MLAFDDQRTIVSVPTAGRTLLVSDTDVSLLIGDARGLALDAGAQRAVDTLFLPVTALFFDDVPNTFLAAQDDGTLLRVDASDLDPTVWTLRREPGTQPIAGARVVGAAWHGLLQRVLLVDDQNVVVWALDPVTNALEAWAGVPDVIGVPGAGTRSELRFIGPSGIAVDDDGFVFVSDRLAAVVVRIDSADSVLIAVGDGTQASVGEGSPSRAFPVDGPFGVAVDAFGNLLVSSRTSLRLVTPGPSGHVDGDGEVRTLFTTNAEVPPPLDAMQCLAGVAVRDTQRVSIIDGCLGAQVDVSRRRLPP